MALVATQFFLGFFHHKIYKRTQRTTKLAAPHVWLGRLVIILGVINAFLGFRLAQVPNYNYVLAGLVIAVVPVCLFVLLWHRVFRRQRASRRARDEAQGIGIGYQTEPWRDAPPAAPGQGPAHGYHTPAGSPPKYEDIQGAIGLRDMGPSASSSANKERSRGGRNDIGAEATPREFA